MQVDDRLVEKIVDRVMEALQVPLIQLEASGRHCHMTREAVDALFGKGYQLTRVSDLSQPGQFVCKERIEVAGPKGSFKSVVILGPERPETQVELSMTDAMTIGIKAPVRLSGHIQGTPGARLIGPKGEYDVGIGVIIAERHIHMTPGDAQRFGVHDGQVVSVRVEGDRSVTFHKTALRVSPHFETFMHIDYDEANACGFQKGMVGRLILED